MIRQKLFPVLLIVLMALLTFWLDQVSSITTIVRDLNPNRPEFSASGLTATRFDEHGQLYERLVAERAWQFPKQHDVYFDKGVLTLYRAGATDSVVKAETGHYNPRTRQGFFDRKVRMDKPAGAEGPASSVDTSAMSLDGDKGLLRSNRYVEMHHGNSVATGVGFTYDYRNKQLHLLSNARITYAK
ncbi:LPS export ABC transporter periplasmic protein LptC [Paludibacterium paludis]|uniref:LPS export ABC transporter periplasmic protein LptC n=1 Tax=Paludibacterium paludis TaxID=1225769 RepID=A0A918U6S8_9NEIS|nr:LPS export ABC transporter periplasmic protein LptC [Paludibacterium paludis]GGY02643.1 hypothetical protein GCM10011289_00980 [Paludibacterium paludis]